MSYDNPPRATIDFESRSTISLRTHGSWRYSCDPTTEVLCLAFRLPYWADGRTSLWHPAFPQIGIEESQENDELAELFQWIDGRELIEAHNAWFERGIWTNKMVPASWPVIRHEQWRCSAAKAAAHSLPRALEDAVLALRLDEHKIDLDSDTRKKMFKPRNANKGDWKAWGKQHAPCMVCKGVGRVASLKKDGTPTVKGVKCEACGGSGVRPNASLPPMPVLWHESQEQMEILFHYCRQDVIAEEGISLALPDLSEDETEIYLLDQAVNERGFAVDEAAIDAALILIDGECKELNAELCEITEGVVQKATQRAQMIAWLETQGLKLHDTRKETLDELLDRDVDGDNPPWAEAPPPKARRAIELMRMLGRSSTAKYVTGQKWVCPDHRVHGGLLYHGASTGRWSGAGLQPHNFPKGNMDFHDQEALWKLLKTTDTHRILHEIPLDDKGKPAYGSVMEALAQGLRGMIVPRPGHQLYVADYASIEARVLLWLAGDDAGMEIFRTHGDIYCDMASSIYGYTCNKKDHPVQRGVGKVAVLGLGYQMGASKFVDTCLLMAGIVIKEDHYCKECGEGTKRHRRKLHEFVYKDEDDPEEATAVKVVDAYRAKYWRVREMWADYEASAIQAADNEGEEVICGKVTWLLEDGFLYCTLPSGRRLAYPGAEVRPGQTSWGEIRNQLTYMGIDQYTRSWKRQTSYGGLLVENVDQAVSRDLMAAAMLRCERSGVYTPVLSVHDEAISEAKLGTGSVKEYEALISTCPPWADGCPVEAEAWCGTRYRK